MKTKHLLPLLLMTAVWALTSACADENGNYDQGYADATQKAATQVQSDRSEVAKNAAALKL